MTTRTQIVIMQRAHDNLLRQHQAIIDAWFTSWIKREKARIDEAFRHGTAVSRPNGETL